MAHSRAALAAFFGVGCILTSMLAGRAQAAPTVSDPSQVEGYDTAAGAFGAPFGEGPPLEKSRFIVQLSANAVSGDTLLRRGKVVPAAIGAQSDSSAVARAQNQVKAEFGGEPLIPSAPFMLIELSRSDLKKLALSGKVGRMFPDRVRPLVAPKAKSTGVAPAADQPYAMELGSGVSIAILDTGVDSNHPYLGNRVVAEACYSTTNKFFKSKSVCPAGEGFAEGKGAAAPCIYDCSHGTHVAGIAAGNRGVAPRAQIVAVQVFSYFEDYHDIGAFDSDLIRAMDWVLRNAKRYNIVSANLSLGSDDEIRDPCDTDKLNGLLTNIAGDAARAGIAVAIASGNSSHKNGVGSPACLKDVATIGSTTVSDAISDFSNIGPLVDLVAPGSDICSSIPGGGYGRMSGTSMATPYVAGAFAGIRSIASGASVADIVAVLRSTGKKMRDSRPGGLPSIDIRRIDPARAAAEARRKWLRASGPLPPPSDVAKIANWCP